MKLVTDPKGLIFFGLIWLVLVATDPIKFRDFVNLPVSFIVWAICLLFYLTLLAIFLCVLSFVNHHVIRFRTYIPITSSIGLLIVFLLSEYTLHTTSGLQREESSVQLALSLMGAGAVFETLFVRFVMPLILLSDSDAVQHAKKPTPGVLRVADRSLPLNRIIYMASQEHYVRIVMPGETLMHRARLSDLVAQTEPHHGMQPHRSWWISRNARPRMDKSNGRPCLQLADETQAPIAKARLKDVRDWLDANTDW